MRTTLALALAAAAILTGCGGTAGATLEPADPLLPAYCEQQPNAEPICTQGSNVRVQAVLLGDACRQALNPAGINGPDGQWREGNGGELLCQAGDDGQPCTVDNGNSAPPERGEWQSGDCVGAAQLKQQAAEKVAAAKAQAASDRRGNAIQRRERQQMESELRHSLACSRGVRTDC